MARPELQSFIRCLLALQRFWLKMAQPLEDANPTSRCPPCTAMSTLPPSFGLSAAFTGQRLPLPPPLSLPLPPPPPGGCPPHPMLMLQWMRSLFSQQPPLSQPSTSSPLVSAQPSLQSLHGTSETAQMVGLLSSAKNGAAPPHGSAQSIAPHSPPPIQALNPFVHESMEWHHNNQVRKVFVSPPHIITIIAKTKVGIYKTIFNFLQHQNALEK